MRLMEAHERAGGIMPWLSKCTTKPAIRAPIGVEPCYGAGRGVAGP